MFKKLNAGGNPVEPMCWISDSCKTIDSGGCWLFDSCDYDHGDCKIRDSCGRDYN